MHKEHVFEDQSDLSSEEEEAKQKEDFQKSSLDHTENLSEPDLSQAEIMEDIEQELEE